MTFNLHAFTFLFDSSGRYTVTDFVIYTHHPVTSSSLMKSKIHEVRMWLRSVRRRIHTQVYFLFIFAGKRVGKVHLEYGEGIKRYHQTEVRWIDLLGLVSQVKIHPTALRSDANLFH